MEGSHNAQTYPAYIRFEWKADVMEACIATRERELAAKHPPCDLRSIQTSIKWQKKFAAILSDHELNGLRLLGELRCEVISSRHYLTSNVVARHDEILSRWNSLRRSSEDFKERLVKSFNQHKNEKKLVKFSKQANAIYTWIELANKELDKPVQTDSPQQLQQAKELFTKLSMSKGKVLVSFERLHRLDHKIRSLGITKNPYTSITMTALNRMWRNFEKVLAKRTSVVDLMLSLAQQKCQSSWDVVFSKHDF